MLAKLDKFGTFTPDGAEEVANLLTALEKEGRRVDIRGKSSGLVRIYLWAHNSKSANAVRGSKKP